MTGYISGAINSGNKVVTPITASIIHWYKGLGDYIENLTTKSNWICGR